MPLIKPNLKLPPEEAARFVTSFINRAKNEYPCQLPHETIMDAVWLLDRWLDKIFADARYGRTARAAAEALADSVVGEHLREVLGITRLEQQLDPQNE